MGCVSVSINRKDNVSSCVTRVGRVSASVSLVCDFIPSVYLRVSPVVAWIYDDMPAIFQVESNTKWRVE